MVALRRSSRQQSNSKKKQYKEEEDDVDGSEEKSENGLEENENEENDDDEDESAGLSDTSEDEWVPPTKKRQTSAANEKGRKRSLVNDSDSESSEGDLRDIDDDRDKILNKKPRSGKRLKVSLKKKNSEIPTHKEQQQQQQQQKSQTSVPLDEISATAEDESEDETTKAEAKRLWEEFRSRKKNNNSVNTSSIIENKAPGGLDQWLGIKPPAWPSTCPEAMINDRDSLFVGFVYTLNSPSQAEITHCLSHLSKVVQPQSIPIDRLPPSMQHLAPNRRGAMHDMYAWRSLALKRGRDGLGGPEDFGLEEGQEDDGEKYGAKEIAKAIKIFGATDVLVIVSRWYGGTMLGPARFRHIEECAKAALARHMVNEALVDLRAELMELDEKIVKIRSERDATSSPALSATQTQKNSYENLTDPERAQRLIMARKKQIELLQKSAKKQAIGSQPKPLQPHLQENTSAIDEMNAAEEEAAMEVMREMEREEALTQGTNAVTRNEAPDGRTNDATAVEAKEKDSNTQIEVTVPVKKEDDGWDSMKLKEEPSDNFDPNFSKNTTLEAAKANETPSVKMEMEDDADLAGWDAL